MAKGMTRKAAKQTARAGGYKLKTASRLSKSQRSRVVGSYVPKLKPSGAVKTVQRKGRTVVPQYAFIKKKKTPKGTSTPSL